MSRVFLDEPLWLALAQASDTQAAARAWLTLQCSRVDNVEHAVVILRDVTDNTLRPVAVWPDERPVPQELQALLETCAETNSGQLNERGQFLDVGFPLQNQSDVDGMAAFTLANNDQSPDQVIRDLQWGSGWLLARLVQLKTVQWQVSSTHRKEIAHCVQALHEAADVTSGCRAMATRLAAYLQCDRVSVGWRKGAQTQLMVVSHMAIEPQKMNLVRSIEEVMDEAVDQEHLLLIPKLEEVPPRVLLEHQRHSQDNGVNSIATVPLLENEQALGAITLERTEAQEFTSEEREIITDLAVLAGPVIALRKRDEKWLPAKVLDTFKRQARRLLGPAYLGRKIAFLSILALSCFFYFATGTFHVVADASLQGRVLRTISAPVDGFISDAPVRSGETIDVDQLMCQLDDRDLQLERLAQTSRRSQLVLQLQDAEARRERSDASVFNAQIEQVDAELALLNEQISRMKVVAPFAGVIISGDLSQALGSSVSRGDALFEVAPLGDYRVILEIEDTDIEQLAKGLKGYLVLTSMPGEKFAINVERVTPSATAQDGRNVFRVEAGISSTDERLRPGMEGVAKIEVDERRLIWIWNRKLIDWMQLAFWRFSP